MATLGVSARLGSIGPSQTPTVGYSNFFVVIQSPWGVANQWKICSSFASFVRQFGGTNRLATLGADVVANTWGNETDAEVLAGFYAVKGYFDNRGNNDNGVAFVCRCVQTAAGPTAAVRTFSDGGANNTTITAKMVGTPASTIAVTIGSSPKGASYKRIAVAFSQAAITEIYDISNAQDAADASNKSEIVTIALPAGGQLPADVTTPAQRLGNGTPATADAYNATTTDLIGTTAASGARTGLQVFNEQRLGSGFCAVPGKFDTTVRSGLATHSNSYWRTALLGTPSGLTQSSVIDAGTTGSLASANYTAGNFIVGYWPQLRVSDTTSDVGGTLLVDPVGHIAGLGARMDAEYAGPHKSLAGTTHELRGCVDVERASNGQELCDDSGSNTLADSFINTIRFKGNPAAICVWGNRTVATDNRYRQVNAGRTIQLAYLTSFLLLEPLTFEPIDSDGKLFAKAKDGINAFLYELWRHGALFGKRPGAEAKSDDAYFVACDRGNNTDVTIGNGTLVVDEMLVATPNAEQIQLTIYSVSPGAIPSSSPR